MSSAPEYLLQSENLQKYFGDQVALENISCFIDTPALGLLGPNGSGKTTFIKLMLKLIHPTSGSVHINPQLKDVRVIPDQPKLPGELTVDEWVQTLENLHGDLAIGVDLQSVFELQGDWQIKTLSAGQTRKVALMPIFFGKPDLVVLDEPTNFLDIISRETILTMIKKHIHDIGASLILATHRLSEMRILTEDIILLKEGKLLRVVSLIDTSPVSFSIATEEMDQLKTMLNEQNISFQVAQNNYGEFVKVPPSDKLWEVLGKFSENGGMIESIHSNDELQHVIEELIF